MTHSEWTAVRRAIRLLEINRRGFLWSVLAGAAGLGCSVGLAAVSAWLIARASQMPPVLDLAVAATSVRALGVGKALFRYLNRIASHRVALYGMSSLRTSVYGTLADSRTDVVTSIRRGDLLARTGQDIDSVGDLVVRSLQPAAVAGLVSILSVGIVSFLSPAIGLVLLVCLVISGVVAPLIAMRGARLAEHAQVTDRAELSAQALTLLESADELRISGRLGAMEEATAATERRIFVHRDGSARPVALATTVDLMAMALATVLSIVIGVHQVASGALNGIELAVVVLTPLAAFEATQVMSMAALQLVRSASAAERIVSLVDAAEASVDTSAAPAPTAETGLVVKDAVIGWPGGPDVAGPLALTIERGHSLAIVGPSGIGKTTLLYTLAGMLRPHTGSVTLDGEEISYLSREAVSRTLTLTAEDAHIFETTILENLRVSRGDLSEDEAIELLHVVGLGEWLSGLPRGVRTLLGTDATTISGGERRRLLLARAIASRADYLLLDEPGEHLDAETADYLIRDLLTAGKRLSEHTHGSAYAPTVVVVTHRLSPLDAADRIVVLDTDQDHTFIRAEGTHAELIATLPEYRWSTGREVEETS